MRLEVKHESIDRPGFSGSCVTSSLKCLEPSRGRAHADQREALRLIRTVRLDLCDSGTNHLAARRGPRSAGMFGTRGVVIRTALKTGAQEYYPWMVLLSILS